MAAIGLFTYHDLYAGKPEIYRIKSPSEPPTSTAEQLVSLSTTETTTLFSTISEIVEVVSSNTTSTSTTSNNLYKFVQAVPFAYLHWLLLGLAVLLILVLSIVFTCYCRGHCRKNGKTRK